MKAFLILVACTLLTTQEACAQKKVGDGSFNTLLKIMLNHKVKEITVAEASTKKKLFFVDARELKEYNISHIQGAVYAGYKDFSAARIAAIPKGSEVIVYCSIGKRSEDVTEKLIKAGYIHATNLYGGIFEWVNQGNPIFDSTNRITNNVHAYGKFWGRWLRKGRRVYN